MMMMMIVRRSMMTTTMKTSRADEWESDTIRPSPSLALMSNHRGMYHICVSKHPFASSLMGIPGFIVYHLHQLGPPLGLRAGNLGSK